MFEEFKVLLLTICFLRAYVLCCCCCLGREGGRKLWKGFNLLRGGSCAVNTPATSSLGCCQEFLQPRLCEGGRRRRTTRPHRCFLSVPSTSQPDAKRINSGSFRTTTSRLCPKPEPVVLLTGRAWCMTPVCVLAQ